MPWIYDDSEINGVIDGNIKSSPPAPPMANSAVTLRAALKAMWAAMRGQVKTAVDSIDAQQASLVARSLNLNAVIYLNTITGDDSRTGATNNNHVTTGAVKTLDRVIELHSGKTNALQIFVAGGIVEVTKNYAIRVSSLEIRLEGSTAGLVFKKRTLLDAANINVGEGNYSLTCYSREIVISNISGRLEVEGHAGSTGAGDQSFYALGQGALAISGQPQLTTYNRHASINVYNWSANFIIGENATFTVSGIRGTFEIGSKKDIYTRYTVLSTTTIAASAKETTLLGDRVFHRQYHPISSTDANVAEGETVISPTNNKLWTKRANVIRDAMGTTFA